MNSRGWPFPQACRALPVLLVLIAAILRVRNPGLLRLSSLFTGASTSGATPANVSSRAAQAALEPAAASTRAHSHWWFIGALQLCFLLSSVLHLNGPFLSYHNERQNQTFDTARHVFREGWSAVFTPKASFSFPGYEARPYTVVRQEVPFHGLLAWPLVKLFGHEAAAVRLVSIIFALFSIYLFYRISRHWLAPGPAAGGTALWTFSPMLLHFGQVPMPDVLCTAGILAAFWFALRNNLPVSSAAFLFAILAKLSIAVFGLPVLVALVGARKVRTLREFLRLSLCWGTVPLIGLVSWTSLEFFDPNTPFAVARILSNRGGMYMLLSGTLYSVLFACLVPYGLGILGSLAFLAGVGTSPSGLKPSLKWALVVSNILYLVLVFSKVTEPQYLLPIVAWASLGAAFGLSHLASIARRHVIGRIALAALVCLQVLTTIVFACDLKASRLTDFGIVQEAAERLPSGSRVILFYPFYGGSPAVWLNKNVMATVDLDWVKVHLTHLQQEGFSHIVLMDLKRLHEGSLKQNLKKMLASFSPGGRSTAGGRDPLLTDYAVPSSPYFQYCDSRFTRLFSNDWLVVYALPSAGDQSHAQHP
jgi:Dolichyl-phosphate-mannose-protein mannosyltransferase